MDVAHHPESAPSRTLDLRRRGRAVARVASRYARDNPVALGFALIVLAASVATGSLWGADALAWGAGPLSTFVAGRWWTLLTALFVPDSTVETVLTLLLALTAFAWAERLLGHLRVVMVGAGVGVMGLLAAIGLHAALWTVTDLRPVEATELPVLEPSLLMIGAIMAATAFAPALWRRRIRLVGFGLLAMFALYAGDGDSWYRVATAVLGLIVGAMLASGTVRHTWHRSSTREIRTLVAFIVAISGLGPLVALIGGGGRGPLSLVVDAFAQYDADLVQRCTTVEMPTCDDQFALVVTRGVGPALLAVVPLLLLLIAAWGLRQGRRAAWALALGVNMALAAIAVLSWASGRLVIDPWVDGSGLEYVLWSAASIGVPLAIVVALIVERRRFPIRATRAATRVYTGVVSVAFVVSAGTLLVIEALGRRDFSTSPSALDLLVVTLRRFVPPVFLQPAGHSPYPHHGAALFAYQWMGVFFWAIMIVATLLLYRRPRRAGGPDGALYRQLLRRGSDTLGFLGTWRGSTYWYSPDRSCAVAYRVVGDVALAVGDPLAPDGRRLDAVRGFVDAAIEQGWAPVFYSVHDDTANDIRSLGWQTLPLGVETVMDLEGLEFVGKSWQKVRQPLTRAEREGFTALWTRWHDLSVVQTSQIVEIDEEWVADRALPEMGFTLGSLEEIKDPEVRLLLAIGPEGRIEAVTSWMPSWRGGEIDGWTLDFMRRRADGPNGMMEFLIAKAALTLRDEGARLLSLSGAPLADEPGDAAAGDPTLLRSLLRWLAGALEPAYGFASLFRFKSKFRPRYRPLYLAYRDPLELPAIGTAIARAHVPDATPREVLALLRTVRGAA